MDAQALEARAPISRSETVISSVNKFVVFQTAFIGDVVLVTPLLAKLQEHFVDAAIDVVVIPAAAPLLDNHPAVREVIVYDKRGADRGPGGVIRLVQRLKRGGYDAALIPHRSLRSGIVCSLAGIPRRIGFSTSAAALLMTDVVRYRKEIHETHRNLSLLTPLQIDVTEKILPELFPSAHDKEIVDRLLQHFSAAAKKPLVAIAPGSVWATKRWPVEKFASLAEMCITAGTSVVLIGGDEDRELSSQIIQTVGSSLVIDATGRLPLLQSAELIRRCRVLVTNDSAPLHLGVAMRTPVIAIFGATVPEFGFGPMGENDVVVQRSGLPCKPCAIHGGPKCPLGTFECMLTIDPGTVMTHVRRLAGLA